MADSDKDILITPSTGLPADPSIVFTGFDNNPITLDVLDAGTLSFSGSSGQLFSISDDLTGTIFSVNDISGIPSIEVIDDGTVLFAEFSGNVLIGTATDNATDKVQISGDVLATNFKGDLIGNADTATTAAAWTTTRTLTLTGDVTGSVSFDGSGAINMTNTVVANNSHTHTESDITDLQSYLLNITGESLSDLSDVSTAGSPAPVSGDVLTYNGTFWANQQVSLTGITDNATTSQITISDTTVDFNGDIHLPDNSNLYVGDSNDFELYHSGSAYLVNYTGAFFIFQYLNANYVYLGSKDTSGNLKMGVVVGGATPDVRLNYNGILTLKTVSGGVNYPDDMKAFFGDGDDLQIYHNGTTSFIKNVNTDLYIREWVNSGIISLSSYNSAGVDKTGILIGGATPFVRLYYDGIPALSTTAGGGIDVPGDGLFGANNSTGAITVQSGDDATGSTNRTQIRFGFNNSTTYPHFITTRHNSGSSTGNAIEFYTSDGTSAGVYPTNAVLNLTLEAGNATFAGDVTITGTMNADAVDINGLAADAAPDGAADYILTYDASAGTNKKVLLDDLPGGASALADLSDVSYVGSPAPIDGDVLTYNGSGWINEIPVAGRGSSLFEYTATAGQTVFSGADDNNDSLLYTVDNILVILNGAVLDGADYTATNGTSVVLNAGADVGSSLNILAFGSIAIADQTGSSLYEYTATASQTVFTGLDDNSATLTYTASQVLVILNGTVLDSVNYTATNGTSIVLSTGAAVGSSLNILAFGSITIANTYTKTETEDLAIAYAIAL